MTPANADLLRTASRGNRRRLLVFTIVFVVGLVAGMTWNLLRPSVYRASARIQLRVPPSSASTQGAGTSEFLALVQTIDGGPALQAVAAKLPEASLRAAVPEAGDARGALDRMVEVGPVPGTDIVQIATRGREPDVLAPVIEMLVEVLRGQLTARYETENEAGLAALREELARLEKAAAERRGNLEAFRSSVGIVSTERTDSAAVSRSQGMANALNTALEKQAAADARVSMLQQAASGAATGRGREDATLSGQESRLSALREEMREMERVYTPEFMARDPRALSLRTRLSEMQRQVSQRRIANQEAALAAAIDESDAARVTVERLRARLQDAQAGLKTFTTRFARSKHLEDDLAQVERARRETLERLARLEASQRSRAPRLTVLESPRTPTEPVSPDRMRDGLLAAALSFLGGLLAMGFVELFNRAPASPSMSSTTLVLPPATFLAGPHAGTPVLGHAGTVARLADVGSAATPLLEAADPRPRELSQDEAQALLAAAQGPGRLACAAALLGLTIAEMTSARVADLGAGAGALQVQGASPRRLVVPEWFVAQASAGGAAELALLRDEAGRAWQAEDVQLAIACAAVDAGLPRPGQVTADVLRNTCIGWLVDQGLRFADFGRVLGRIDPETVAAFGDRAQRVTRRPIDEIDVRMPALRRPIAA